LHVRVDAQKRKNATPFLFQIMRDINLIADSIFSCNE